MAMAMVMTVAPGHGDGNDHGHGLVIWGSAKMVENLVGWMGGWVDGWMVVCEWVHGCMGGSEEIDTVRWKRRVHKRSPEAVLSVRHGWMEGWLDGCMDGWSGGEGGAGWMDV